MPLIPQRRKTRVLRVGNRFFGGDHPIPIQSMTNTDTHDVAATLAQVQALAAAGCEIVRLTVPDVAAAQTFRALKTAGITLPLVADIHFDYRVALAAVEAGADKIRINPGNIGGADKVAAVVHACRAAGVPIRIGVNSGSVEPALLQQYGGPTPEAMVASAMHHVHLLEELDFHDYAVSVKASDVRGTIAANRLLAGQGDFPIHLGVTEAGARTAAWVKSAVGIGTLLAEGIGDTVRVSLTEDPTEEIAAARQILASLDLLPERGMDIVSCPTCGRTKISLIPLVEQFEARVRAEGLQHKNLRVALMGCVVNGPGEAREADVGIAGGKGEGLLFRHGEIIAKVPEERLLDALMDEIRRM